MVSDLNSEIQSINRPYTREIINIQDIEKTVREIDVLLSNEGISMIDEVGICISEVTDYDLKNIPRRNHNIENVGNEVYTEHKRLMKQVNILEALELQFQGNRNGGVNAHFLATGMDRDMMKTKLSGDVCSYQAHHLEAGDDAKVGLRYISGIVKLPLRHAFQRQVFLITRGNSYVLFRYIECTEEVFTFMVLYLGNKFGCQLRRLCDFIESSSILRVKISQK